MAARGSGSTAHGRTWPENGWYDLVSVPATGGPATSLARVGAREEKEQVVQASFGPEGKVFYSEQIESKKDGPATTELVSIGAGGERRVHLRFPYEAEVVVSPDGRWAAVQADLNIQVVPLPLGGSGAVPVVLNLKEPALPMKQVSEEGGLFPRWRDNDALEFVSGNRYFVHHRASGKTDSTPIRLLVPRVLPKGSIALSGARILTMDSRKVIERGTVVIKRNRIACVGECDAAGADRVIDVSGKTIIPGLIDMHAHFNYRKAIVIPPHNFESAVYLAYGVTTTLDPSATSTTVFTNAELIRAGQAIGPRIYSSGEPIYDYLSSNPDEVTQEAIDLASALQPATYEDTEHDVNRLVAWGAASIKQYMGRRRDQRQWVVEAARKKGVMVTGEAGSFEFELGMIMDGQPGWEHEILAIPLYRDAARFIGQARATYSATFCASGPGPWDDQYFYAEKDLWKDEKLRRFIPSWDLMSRTRRRMLRPASDYGSALYAQAMADIIAEGGYGAVGGHGQFIGMDTHFDIWMAAQGLGAMGALEVATIQPAHFLGADRDLGSLAPGKLADLVVLNSNPLDDIRHTTDALYVMQDGVLYDSATLDEVWPVKKPFGDTYWVNPEALQSDDRPDDFWDRKP